MELDVKIKIVDTVFTTIPAGTKIADIVITGSVDPAITIYSTNYMVTKTEVTAAVEITTANLTAIHFEVNDRQSGDTVIIDKVYPKMVSKELNKFNKPNTIYKITKDIDLNHCVLTIPEGCTLDFQGGSFSNGAIVGNGTSIIAGIRKIFTTTINLKGKWDIELIYPQWYGAKGDDDTDDTLAILTLFNNYSTLRCKIVIPKGIYKVTEPIILTNYDGKLYSPYIEGGLCHFNMIQSCGSVIKAYGIKKLRAAIEILGNGNTNAVSPIINNIQITLDNSCDPLSFCLFLGDSHGYSINNCKFVGYNSVMYRSGSYNQASSYSHINSSYRNVVFLTNRYVDWDGETVNEKNKYGFALAYEGVFSGTPDTIFKYGDTILMDTCYIAGTIINNFNNALYNNCMFYIPGNYKPIDTSIFKTTFLTHNKFSCSIGIYIMRGNVILNAPYFEDSPKCIFIQLCVSVIINNIVVVGTFAVKPIINGEVYKGEYVLNTASSTNGGLLILLNGGSITEGNVGFLNTIVNNGVATLNINYLMDYKPDYNIEGNYSLVLHNKNINKVLNRQEWAAVLKNEIITELEQESRRTFTFVGAEQVNKIKVLFDGVYTGSGTLTILNANDNNVLVKMAINSIDPQVTKFTDSNKDTYTLNNVLTYNLESLKYYKKYNILGNTPIKVLFTNSSGFPLNGTNIKVILYTIPL